MDTRLEIITPSALLASTRINAVELAALYDAAGAKDIVAETLTPTPVAGETSLVSTLPSAIAPDTCSFTETPSATAATIDSVIDKYAVVETTQLRTIFTGLDALIAQRIRIVEPPPPTPIDPCEAGEPGEPGEPGELGEPVPTPGTTPASPLPTPPATQVLPAGGPAYGISWAAVDAIAAKTDVNSDQSVLSISRYVKVMSQTLTSMLYMSVRIGIDITHRIQQLLMPENDVRDQPDKRTRLTTQGLAHVRFEQRGDQSLRIEETPQLQIVDGQVRQSGVSVAVTAGPPNDKRAANKNV